MRTIREIIALNAGILLGTIIMAVFFCLEINTVMLFISGIGVVIVGAVYTRLAQKFIDWGESKGN